MTASPLGDRDATAEDQLSAPARTLLFAPLGSTDMPSAVVHRLRAAIGLGLLPDGKRLPKESELATQLGVTTFALREALAELRNQGLVVTRAGKYGGSFVTYPVESEQLEHDELAQLSAAELRDVGDWRQMLTAQTAVLAAQRASASNVATLATLAARVGDADSSVTARRAHGRFQLELASAAQSMRMTRAEFAVHEQIDWLFGLALHTESERAACATSLQAVANAVKARNPKRARAAAETHIARIVARLAQLRLEAIASGRGPTRPGPARTLKGEVGEVVKALRKQLAGLASDVAPVLSGGDGFQHARSRVSLAGLQRFEQLPPYVKGLGVVAEVGLVEERPRWIEWWLRTDNGPVVDNHHVLDPSREDFYDYQDMEFIARPRETHKTWASGPYVDYGGVDNYILSVAAPITARGKFYGVSCADILVADLESVLSAMLAAAPESYLINSESRVIVSNSVRFGVGDLMTEREGFDVDEFPEFGWSLVTRS